MAGQPSNRKGLNRRTLAPEPQEAPEPPPPSTCALLLHRVAGKPLNSEGKPWALNPEKWTQPLQKTSSWTLETPTDNHLRMLDGPWPAFRCPWRAQRAPSQCPPPSARGVGFFHSRRARYRASLGCSKALFTVSCCFGKLFPRIYSLHTRTCQGSLGFIRKTNGGLGIRV